MRIWPAALIVAAAVTAIVLLLNALSLDQRINVFLPRPADPHQALVIDQIGAGQGGRMMLAAISGADPRQLATYSRQLASLWRGLPGLQRVENGEQDLDQQTEEMLMRLRFLLVDDIKQRLAPKAIDEQLDQRVSEITLGGSRLQAWVRRDPLGLLPELGDQLTSTQAPRNLAGVWFDADGDRALLVVMSEHPAFATDAQASLVADMRKAFASLDQSDSLTLELAGAPVIAIDSAATSRREATRLSIVASLFLVVVLLWFWRSATLVIAASVPLSVGIVCGLLVTVAAFNQVHGLTLAFGFTLLGVALDYPIHLVAHAGGRSLHQAAREILQPLLLGAASTIIAYLAIWSSTSPGLAQLGAFSAAGLAGAVAATLLLPKLLLRVASRSARQPMRRWRLQWLPPSLPPILAAIAIAALYFQGDRLWSSDLSRLTPVNAEIMALDAELRQALGTGDVRHLLVTTESSIDDVLASTEATEDLLGSAREAGLVSSWQAVTAIIPSQHTQTKRRAAWPDAAGMDKLLRQARTPFKPQAFQPFLDDLSALDQSATIGPDSWDGTLLQTRVDSLLKHTDSGWLSIIIPAGMSDARALADFLRQSGSAAHLVDLRATSEAMVSAYRRDAGISLAIAAVLISLLLWLRLRGLLLTMSVLTPPLAALLCTALIMSMLHQGLTIIHMIGLLLASSIGLDYAIFSMTLNRSNEQIERTNHSINVCALSSGGVFLILGQSDIGMLHMLGLTVATGIFLSWIFSRSMQASSQRI
ncbi:MAG: MMPL family transporter [Wenzhouxiangellaceae bacterium]|nr:MMPL family transporter [Wenzhouxiangellaceae bacterium]